MKKLIGLSKALMPSLQVAVNSSRGFSGVLVLMFTLAVPARADWNTLLTDAAGISGFELHRNGLGGLYWWHAGPGKCGVEFPIKSTVRLRGYLSATTASQFNLCSVLQDSESNCVRDDDYLYLFLGSYLYAHRPYDSENYVDVPFFTDPTLIGKLGTHLELVNDVFYGGSFDSGSGYVYLWSKSVSTSDAADLLCFITDGGAPLHKLKAFTYEDSVGDTVDAIAVLLSNGRLYQCVPSDFGDVQLLATGVTDFAIHTSHSVFGDATSVYATIGTLTPSPSSLAGYLVRINPDTRATTLLYTADSANQLLSVTTDSDQFVPLGGGSDPKNVYFTEAIVTCAGGSCSMPSASIYSHPLPWGGGAPSPMVSLPLVNGFDGQNLRSDDKTLYFIGYDLATGQAAIKTNSTSAEPFQFDIQADWLEVVQTIQNSANEVPLVANKEIAAGTGAYVRGYAHLRLNNSGYRYAFPSASLRAFVEGVELPGSPFVNLNSVTIDYDDSLPALRPNRDRSFLFKLPPLPPGNLSLEMTVNHNRALKETGLDPFANNLATLSKDMHVLVRGRPFLVAVTLPTPVGSYSYGGPGFWDIKQRALTLLPVQDFQFRLPPDNLSLAHGLYFNDISDDDKEDIALEDLAKLNCKTKSPGLDPHWLGMVPSGTPWAAGGVAYRPGSELVVTMTGPPSDFQFWTWDHPFGGRTLAHELGHNYGKQHIDQTLCLSPCCGGSTPKNPDSAYPFAPCCFGWNFFNAWYGFDPITRLVIAPCQAADLMSYATSRWISPYHYGDETGGLFQSIPPPLPVAAPLAAAGAAPANLQQGGPVLLVAGFINPVRKTAKFLSFDQFPVGAADAEKVDASFAAARRARNLPNPYLIRLLDVDGANLGEIALEIRPSIHEPETRLSFIQFIPFDPQTLRIQLVQSGASLAERIVSPHAPTLTLQPVTFDPVAETLRLSWSASDADNDPLEFTVQYSTDDGASWIAARINYPWLAATISVRRLQGSPRARFRVIASDGANSTLAMTPPFVVESHSPEALLDGVLEGERIPFGLDRQLQGLIYDAEDGSLPNASLNWTVSGPATRDVNGASVSLEDLSPGSYMATLFGFDSENNFADVTRSFEILPVTVPEGTGPFLDGLCNDPGYASAVLIKIPRGDGDFVRARLMHAGSNLFVSFTDLQLPSSPSSRRSIGLRVDANDSRDSRGSAGDIGFFVDSDGIAFQESGTGTGMTRNLSPRRGFVAVINRGANGWSAEFQIAESLIGGWDHAVGIMFAHDTAHWPTSAVDQQPVTWAPAWFGSTLPPTSPRPPVASAGPDQILDLAEPRTIFLDGSGSFDRESGSLSYAWAQLSGPSVTLSSAHSVSPTFVASPFAATTVLEFQLTVTAGLLTSAPAPTRVTLVPAERPPRAPHARGLFNAGQFQGRISGSAGSAYNIEASSNLVNWVKIQSNTADFFGILDFLDADSRLYPERFYRAAPLPPPNDVFANRTPLNGLPVTAYGWNDSATKEAGEPNHAGNAGGKSVWWSWLAPSDGSVTISTIGSSFDTLLAVYVGLFPQLTLIAADDDGGGNRTSRVTFVAAAGATYEIAVDGFNGASGTIVLNITAP